VRDTLEWEAGGGKQGSVSLEAVKWRLQCSPAEEPVVQKIFLKEGKNFTFIIGQRHVLSMHFLVTVLSSKPPVYSENIRCFILSRLRVSLYDVNIK